MEEKIHERSENYNESKILFNLIRIFYKKFFRKN